MRQPDHHTSRTSSLGHWASTVGCSESNSMPCHNCAAASRTMSTMSRRMWTTRCWATSSSNRAKRSSVVANCAPVAPNTQRAGAVLAALSIALGPTQTQKRWGQFWQRKGGRTGIGLVPVQTCRCGSRRTRSWRPRWSACRRP